MAGQAISSHFRGLCNGPSSRPSGPKPEGPLDCAYQYATLQLKSAKIRKQHDMLKLSEEEVLDLIKALVEHQAKLERMAPYPLRKADIKPYKALTQKLAKYRKERWMKKTRKATKR